MGNNTMRQLCIYLFVELTEYNPLHNSSERNARAVCVNHLSGSPENPVSSYVSDIEAVHYKVFTYVGVY